MLNDDYTPVEFVVRVLERFFQKNREEATRITLHVHRRGVGVCGANLYKITGIKVTQVMDLARQNQHPLQCTIEKNREREQRGMRSLAASLHLPWASQYP